MKAMKSSENGGFTVVVVPNDSVRKKEFKVMGSVVIIGLALVVVVVILFVSILFMQKRQLQVERVEKGELQTQLAQLTTQNETLEKNNEELEEKVTLFSSYINEEKKKKDEEAAMEEKAHIPSGYPLSSTASYTAATADPTKEGGPMAIFETVVDTEIIAAADGVVARVREDSVYGHIVRIDHENGILSIYYSEADPLVKEGDAIEKGDALYKITDSKQKLYYQIKDKEEFVDPMGVMDVNG